MVFVVLLVKYVVPLVNILFRGFVVRLDRFFVRESVVLGSVFLDRCLRGMLRMFLSPLRFGRESLCVRILLVFLPRDGNVKFECSRASENEPAGRVESCFEVIK
jgi:hypothetical protein